MKEAEQMEILAPAGNYEAFKAALEAGADAVYLGLTSLNARRGAKNFEPSELKKVVTEAHAVGVKVHLTLNIDLRDREVGLAYRIIEHAASSGVDVVIVKDPALLALIDFYPNLQFHFSTQAACCNIWDSYAAKSLGISRVVLARENTYEEIAAIAAAKFTEVEVFVQGAMCFCISGRCLLSSWGGGRSGNRGACTSPCRVPWSISENESSGTPFSMYDLSAAEYVTKLQEAGVDSVKIEGRLKSAKWVSQAVGLYRAARDGKVSQSEGELGNYTGRKQSAGFLTGDFSQLTGKSGRVTTQVTEVVCDSKEQSDDNKFTVHIDSNGTKILLKMNYNGLQEEASLVKSKVGKRGTLIKELILEMADEVYQGIKLSEITCSDESFIVPNRFTKQVETELGAFIRRCNKVEKNVQVKLSEEVKLLSMPPASCSENNKKLSGDFNTIRIEADFIDDFAQVENYYYILENANMESIALANAIFGCDNFALTLPDVFYDCDKKNWEEICQEAATEEIVVEVNSWGGLALAKSFGCKIVAGPGLAVTNGRAAAVLAQQGCREVFWSIEADKEMLIDLTLSTPVASAMTVFSYPVLMKSRVKYPEKTYGKEFRDRRNNLVIMQWVNGQTWLRSKEAYSLL
ncbi:MAG: U32 family peptidase, partial [Lentisphaeria bacterium]